MGKNGFDQFNRVQMCNSQYTKHDGMQSLVCLEQQIDLRDFYSCNTVLLVELGSNLSFLIFVFLLLLASSVSSLSCL